MQSSVIFAFIATGAMVVGIQTAQAQSPDKVLEKGLKSLSSDAQTQTPDPALRTALAQNTVLINGSANPNALPSGMLLKSLYRDLRNQNREGNPGVHVFALEILKMSETDASTLAKQVASDKTLEQQRKQKRTKETWISIQNLCTQAFPTTTAQLSAAEFARALYEIDRTTEQQLSAHYEKLLSALSTNGQKAVRDYMYSYVAPQLTYARIDYPELYAAEPKSMTEVFEHSCASDHISIIVEGK